MVRIINAGKKETLGKSRKVKAPDQYSGKVRKILRKTIKKQENQTVD